MRRIFLYIGFFLIILINACSLTDKDIKKNDDNLFGKVKAVREKTYESIVKDGVVTQGDVIGSYYDNIKTEYDQKGRKIKQYLYFNNDSISYIYIFVYDTLNKIREKQIFNSSNELSYKYIYNYTLGDKELNRLMLGSTGDTLSFYEIVYNNEIEVKRNFYDKTNILTGYHLSVYDSVNRLVQKKVFDEYDLLTSSTSYEYDNNGNRLSESVYLATKIAYKYVYRYNVRNQLVEEGHFDENNICIATITYSYNKDANILEIKHFDKDNYLTNSYVFDYNSEGVLTEKKKITDKLIYKTSYIYDTDKFNNWVKRIEYVDDSPVKVTLRDIEYFN